MKVRHDGLDPLRRGRPLAMGVILAGIRTEITLRRRIGYVIQETATRLSGECEAYHPSAVMGNLSPALLRQAHSRTSERKQAESP